MKSDEKIMVSLDFINLDICLIVLSYCFRNALKLKLISCEDLIFQFGFPFGLAFGFDYFMLG